MAATSDFGLDVGIYGPLATPETILDLAQLGEAAGFDSLWLADHVAFPVSFASRYPYSATGTFPSALDGLLMEPIATMGVLAGATKRVKLGTAVLIMPYRNPVLLARMLATIDQFSGGRVVLGAGVGWLKEEFEVLGNPDFARRGRMTDEYLEIFKAICAGGEVGYQGQTYRFEPVFSAPGSVQRPHPPILVGGLSEAALRRVVRHGDGWLAVTMGPARTAEMLARLRQLASEHGRSYEQLQLTYKLFLDIGEAKKSRFDEREPGSGSEAQVIDDLKALRDLGFTRIVVRHRGSDAKLQRQQIEHFVERIVPRV